MNKQLHFAFAVILAILLRPLQDSSYISRTRLSHRLIPFTHILTPMHIVFAPRSVVPQEEDSRIKRTGLVAVLVLSLVLGTVDVSMIFL